MRKLFILFFITLTQAVCAQRITGVVVDEETGDSIPYPSVQYKEDNESTSGDAGGRFSVVRHNDRYLTFSAVGYKTLRILIGPNTPPEMRVTLKPDTKKLKEVTVKAKRGKYSRKNNPAVELMRPDRDVPV